ncbi:GMC oxidoreductase-domain-containing protein [Apiospora aurea]|uniref:GMC oxidoreductase-domain-containing protein n=1 Tax=Apiospora aurea TaxID=335848 RepID=A0ABR1Q4L0_9PEZI
MLLPVVWDYIVVGGGIAGSVVSSRLLEQDPSLKILLIEAGPDVSDRTDITYINSTNLLMGDFDYNYQTVPQANLRNRQIANPGGRALGGGSVINQGGWTRGSSLDYDHWAETVGDRRWSYAGQLPYFRKSEDYCDSKNPDQHGKGGPIHVDSVTCTGRHYPLRDKVFDSWHEAGVESIPELDGNAGKIIGIGELYENRRDGKRQIASSAYSLKGVTVLTDTVVGSITLAQRDDGCTQATGVRLANGTEYHAKRVVASAGAYRSPQLLLLSGIGPSETLAQHGIQQHVDLPDVGQHLADHMMLVNYWRLKDPSLGYALGSTNPLFQEPQFGLGNPNDWVTTTVVPRNEGARHDPGAPSSSVQGGDAQFGDMENFLAYAAPPSADPLVNMDGTHISTSLASLHPTSRGSVTISSSDPHAPPVIDPNYLSTEADRYVWRESVQRLVSFMVGNGTALGREVVESETPPSAFAARPLSPETSEDDAYLDARIAAGASSIYHPQGTCAMGKVVDSSLRVRGVRGLYVADASVFPVVIGAHLQAAAYALGEQGGGHHC